MASRPWFVFAGGGTGGHLFPALAVAECLRARKESIDVSFLCTQRPIDRQILAAEGTEAIPLGVQPIPARPWGWPRFCWEWWRSVRFCRGLFRHRRPAVVVGAGGYASGPPVRAAVRLGIPTFLLNPDALPGRANLHLARKEGLTGVFAGWPVTHRHLPPTVAVTVTGCPVRRPFTLRGGSPAGTNLGTPSAGDNTNAQILRGFGLEPGRRTLLITGASQGARTINEAMIELAPAVSAAGWQVLHLSGWDDRERVASAYAQARTPGVVLPFTDRVAEAIIAADLIVSRAGASTLAEILAVGRPSILLPYPYHRDRHQWHNGAVLVEAGAAVMLEDLKEARVNARQLGAVLTALMSEDARRATMAAAARRLGRPEAARIVADHLLEAARRSGAVGCENLAEEPVNALSRQTA